MRSTLNWLTRMPPCMASAMVPGRARHMRARNLGAAAQDRAGIVVDFRPAHARGHAGAHDGADRRAGYRHRLDAQFVQRLDDVDMRQPARAAAAEGDAEARASPLIPCRPRASVGPTTMMAGSADSSFFAAALTWSSVTAVDLGRRAAACSRCRDCRAAARPASRRWRSDESRLLMA